jgi:hypothetical protein
VPTVKVAIVRGFSAAALEVCWFESYDRAHQSKLKPDSFNGFAGTLRASPGTSRHKEVTSMPTAKELSIELDDRPGTLGKICRSLADRGVNILGFDSKPSDTKGKSEVRLVVDNNHSQVSS